MAKRPERLTRRPQFLAAATGRRFRTDRLTVQGRRRAPDEPAPGLRVGFTVTKREGHATERNRIRRRLREAIRAASEPFGREPVDIVVIGRRAALSAPFGLLLDDLARGLGAATKPKPFTASPAPPS